MENNNTQHIRDARRGRDSEHLEITGMCIDSEKSKGDRQRSNTQTFNLDNLTKLFRDIASAVHYLTPVNFFPVVLFFGGGGSVCGQRRVKLSISMTLR